MFEVAPRQHRHVELILIDADQHRTGARGARGVRILGGRGQHDPLCCPRDVGTSLLEYCEGACCLDHDVNAERLPWKTLRFAFVNQAHPCTADTKGWLNARLVDHRLIVAAVGGIEAQQIHEILRIDQIVDRDHA